MSPPFTDTVFYLPHAVKNVEVPICFEGDRKLYHLLWTELLTTDEVPFQNYEDIELGMRVMAPWCTTEGSISYSEAFVCDSAESSMCNVHYVYIANSQIINLLNPKITLDYVLTPFLILILL